MRRKPHEILNKIRRDQGLTLMDLSEKAGVSFSTVQRLCKGYDRQVSWEMKEKIAKALGTDVGLIWIDEVKELLEERQRLYQEALKMAEAQQVELVKKAERKGRYKKPKDEKELIASPEEWKEMEKKQKGR